MTSPSPIDPTTHGRRINEVEREFDTWFDQGHWLAVLLLPLCLLGFSPRRIGHRLRLRHTQS